MKKLIISLLIFIVIFAACSIGITYGLLKQYEAKFSKIQRESSSENMTETVEEELVDFIPIETPAKGNGIYDSYDENDLVVTTEVVSYHDAQLKIPVLHGLKNKKVEARVNEAIKNQIKDSMKEWAGFGEYFVSGNFSNVISIQYRYYSKDYGVYYLDDHSYFDEKEQKYYEDLRWIKTDISVENFKNDDSYHYGDEHIYSLYSTKSSNIGLNYELINGSRLSFEDLFCEGIDIIDMVRETLYADMLSIWSEGYESGNVEIVRDKNNKFDWRDTYELFSFDEDAFYDTVQGFMKNPQFVFHSGGIIFLSKKDNIWLFDYGQNFLSGTIGNIIFITGSDEYRMDFGYCLPYEKVALFKKYGSYKDLYERNDIGLKDLYFEPNVAYYDGSMLLDNLLFEIMIDGINRTNYYDEVNDDTSLTEYEIAMSLKEDIIKKAEEKKQEAIELATKNPKKQYYACYKLEYSFGARDYYSQSENLMGLVEKFIIREDDNYNTQKEEKIHYYLYDTVTRKELTKVNELFFDDSFINVIQDKLSYFYSYKYNTYIFRNDATVEQIIKNSTYTFGKDDLTLHFDKEYDGETIKSISYSQFGSAFKYARGEREEE